MGITANDIFLNFGIIFALILLLINLPQYLNDLFIPLIIGTGLLIIILNLGFK